MKKIPLALLSPFKALLASKDIPEGYHANYLKWLRYYLDFCHKYGYSKSNPQSLPEFIGKLIDKNQTAAQQKQADLAIHFYYELSQTDHDEFRGKSTQKQQPRKLVKENEKIFGAPSPKRKMQPGQSKPDSISKTDSHKIRNEKWNAALSDLANEIKVRHYSPKTLKSYSTWVRKLKSFCRDKYPAELSTADVKEFLTFLAVKKKVSASSQNQAFNALLFLFRHILKKEFGKIDGVVRAKRKPYIPVVLSREEIDSVVMNLKYPYDLVVNLLYGCGLRLFECLNLRVQSFNFDFGVLTVHDGKGKKDRTVPLPQSIIPDLKAHLEKVKVLHDNDLADGYSGAFMFDSIEKKNIKTLPRSLFGSGFSPAKR